MDQKEQYIAIWAKVVDTQMHFNEMSVKSRQLGLTFVAAALGVAVVLVTRGNDYVLKVPPTVPLFQVHVTVFLIAGAALGLLAVRTLDLNVYHKMLRGAVSFGEDFEEQYMKQIFTLNKGMTQAITHFSQFPNASRRRDEVTGRYVYNEGGERETAEQKIRSFYNFALGFLISAAVVMFIVTNLDIWLGHPPASGTQNPMVSANGDSSPVNLLTSQLPESTATSVPQAPSATNSPSADGAAPRSNSSEPKSDQRDHQSEKK